MTYSLIYGIIIYDFGCVSDTELPVRRILFKAGRKGPHLCCFWLYNSVGQLLKSCIHNWVFGPSHPWIMDILLLLGQLYELYSSNCHLCLEIEIIFRNLSLCVSTFLGVNPVNILTSVVPAFFK